MVLDLFKQLERDGQLAHLPGNTKEDKMKMLRQLLEILRMSESAAVIKVQSISFEDFVLFFIVFSLVVFSFIFIYAWLCL